MTSFSVSDSEGEEVFEAALGAQGRCWGRAGVEPLLQGFAHFLLSVCGPLVGDLISLLKTVPVCPESLPGDVLKGNVFCRVLGPFHVCIPPPTPFKLPDSSSDWKEATKPNLVLSASP